MLLPNRFRFVASVFLMSVICAKMPAEGNSLLLPMYNFKLPSGTKSLGNSLYAGVQVSTPDAASFNVQASSTIFFEPTIAEVKASNFSRSIGANCPVVNEVLAEEVVLAQQQKSLAELLAANEQSITQSSQDLFIANQTCSQSRAALAEVTSLKNDAETVLEAARAEVTAKKTDLLNCKTVALDANQCTNEEALFLAAAEAMKSASAKLEPLLEEFGLKKAKEKSACTASTELQLNHAKFIEIVASSKSALQSIAQYSSDSMKTFGKELGGNAVAVISNNSSKQLAELSAANPGYEFRPILAENVRFQFLAGSEAFPTAARQTVLGISALGAQSDENGKLSGESAKILTSGNGSVAVNVTLSRIGACSDNLVRAAGFFYDYKGYSFVKGNVEYSKFQAYEKFEEAGTSGGFLDSSSFHKLDQSMKGEQGFKFTVIQDDPSLDVEEMKRTLRKELLAELIYNFTEAENSAVGGKLTLQAPGENGAQVLADGLMKTCPHAYCQIGAVALKTLSAAFGSTSSREEIKKTHSQIVTDNFAWTTVYNRKGSSAVSVVWETKPE
jgi:hypothetical protein